jgi:hypothetical protein
MRSKLLLAAVMAALGCALFAAPAQAQRARVFVASYGSDSNPCTFGSPCKTFQHAHDAVAVGGEITAIDSAGFGPVTINKAVTITSPNGVEAGIAAAAGGTAVTVSAGSTDTVVLSGLTLEGAGSGAAGIAFTGGAMLEVVNCAIRNYTGGGISVNTSSNAVAVLISNTSVSDVTSAGISFFSDGGAIQAALDHVTVNNNALGLNVVSFNGPVEVQVADSHIDNNTSVGIQTGGSLNINMATVILKSVTLNQTPTGILIGQYADVYLSEVTQTTVPGFVSTGVQFTSNTSNAVFTDGTSHLMGGYFGGRSTPWATQ